MSNMSYCRFRNTLRDLLDCEIALDESDELNPDEVHAKERLIFTCRRIVENHGDE